MLQRTLLSVKLGDANQFNLPSSLMSSWALRSVTDLTAADKALKNTPYSLALLLLDGLPDTELGAVDALLESHQNTQWVGVFMAEKIRLPAYRALIVQHLFDFHTWPIDPARLNHTLGHAHGYAALSQQPVRSLSTTRDMGLVGQSKAVALLRKQIAKVAQANAPVLIWGESGSGKELTAQAVHKQSRRASAPFIAVNCGAIPASLIQSELFGYERGAFTGAARDKRGLIESAAGGTLFLDEIGDLPLELQVNLLRFLQEGSINRVGSSQSIDVDVRVIAASHRCLQDTVKAGQFREDLLYRLNVLPLTVPALRDRKDDLEVLAKHFFDVFAQDKNSRLTGFSNRALQAIQAYDWPGNVRELIYRVRRG
jgi:DNA-binding NtrC family response regulator